MKIRIDTCDARDGAHITYHEVEGIDLRDLFAMAALAGAARESNNEETVALRAYAYADAMLAARKGGSDE